MVGNRDEYCFDGMSLSMAFIKPIVIRHAEGHKVPSLDAEKKEIL
jgi:hypothetical protein